MKDRFVNIVEVGQDVKTICIRILDEKCYNGFSEIEIIKNEGNDFKLLEKINDDDCKDNSLILKNIDKLVIKINIFLDKVYRKIFIR